MIIDTESEEMFWILCKCNKDLLDFLCDENSLKILQTKRGAWIKAWQERELNEEKLNLWLKHDH